MRGVHIFEKPCYREIRVMRGRAMRGLPVYVFCQQPLQFSKYLMGLRQLLMLNPFIVNECTILIRKVADYFIRESSVRVTAVLRSLFNTLLC